MEKFPVAPLDLSVGQKLTLTVIAKDGDTLNGPHTSHGEKYAFRIVSTEELLSILYQRELNLRQRFEQALTEMKQVRETLERHAARLQTPASRPDGSGRSGSSRAADSPDERSAVSTTTDRALQTVRKDANESAEIELAFRDIRDEVVNNAVQTSQMLERLDERIIAPLQRINSDLYPAVDQALGLLRLATENGRPLREPLDESIRRLTALIARMEQVLQEMHKLETFQEVLETLKAIIRQQRELAEKTKSQHKKQLIEKLKGLGLEPE
ncbi:MAG: hypothetical protein GXP27_21265 [Planctomycetes bacterium]|nr:hypothetical protein [Planctomycetota bacterium]